MDVKLAQPRGFCAGVVRAVEIVQRALDVYGPPVYVLHEIVHNQHVLEDLSRRGAVFTEDLDEVPPGSLTIFSAHGVARSVVDSAEQLNLRVIDATCPLVSKVHMEAQGYAAKGFELVIIGHAGHAEVEGTRGRINGRVHVLSSVAGVEALAVQNPDKLAYVTQTTLSIDDTRAVVDALKKRFPKIRGPELRDICYATQNRQNAVRELARETDLMLVVGARNSSNSNRLREVAAQDGVAAYLIQDASDLESSWFDGIRRVGITAGASTPEVLVERVIERLREWGVGLIEDMAGVPENTTFSLPPALQRPGPENHMHEPTRSKWASP